MMPYGFHDGGWGIVWMIASWIVIVAIVFWIARSFGAPSSPGGRGDGPDADRILEERYARGEISEGGEISEEEFRERQRVLHGR